MSALRVVLDTNILISAIAYPVSIPGRIFSAWQSGQLDVVLSCYILDEMERVLPKFAQVKLSASGIRDLADSFMFRAEIVEPSAAAEASLRTRPTLLYLEPCLPQRRITSSPATRICLRSKESIQS